MKLKRKFYRTVFTYEILSEEPITVEGAMPNLDDIHYKTNEGHASGMFLDHKEEVLDGPTVVARLSAQGSDPGFFELDADGNDLDEEV